MRRLPQTPPRSRGHMQSATQHLCPTGVRRRYIQPLRKRGARSSGVHHARLGAFSRQESLKDQTCLLFSKKTSIVGQNSVLKLQWLWLYSPGCIRPDAQGPSLRTFKVTVLDPLSAHTRGFLEHRTKHLPKPQVDTGRPRPLPEFLLSFPSGQQVSMTCGATSRGSAAGLDFPHPLRCTERPLEPIRHAEEEYSVVSL